MEATRIEPRRAPWQELTLGSTVWAPLGDHGWRPGTISGLGKNRGDNTIVHLRFETGGTGRRLAASCIWRRPELQGKDKPPTQAVSA